MTGRGIGQTDAMPRIIARRDDQIMEPPGKTRPRDRKAAFRTSKRADRKWTRNASDEYAISQGFHFDERRGQHFVDVCRDHLRLWEGEWAGQPFELSDWQADDAMRIFGWVGESRMYKRWVRRFRRAMIFVAKKNGKSPMGAAVGLYLEKWDGEAGSNVYSTAKDGKQALIVHRHAQNMVRKMEPALVAQFSINRSNHRIEHPSTMSAYGILSAENIDGQEGLNGSAIVDEVHVVDHRLIRVIQDMTASRAEGLLFQISTHGKDPQSYGRSEYDYGKSVESGEVKDARFFFHAYEAPQAATDEQLLAETKAGKPTRAAQKLHKMANPSWGLTIDPESFYSAMKKARQSPADWAAFKQRRLNIWQDSANPWFQPGVWDACGEEYGIESLYGLGGGVGIDLSRSRDMSSAVFCCQDDDVRRLWSVIWLPAERADYLQSRTKIGEWIQKGHIRIIPGKTMDLAAVEEDIVELADLIGTNMICFDPRFAMEIASSIGARCRIDPVEFRQSYAEYGPPTEDFERLVIDSTLRHPKNDVLNWHIGNALIVEYGGCKKPIKPKNCEWKTVDGAQAAVMSLKACMLSENTNNRSMFEDPGVVPAFI